jgi:hypothetical protein
MPLPLFFDSAAAAGWPGSSAASGLRQRPYNRLTALPAVIHLGLRAGASTGWLSTLLSIAAKSRAAPARS